MLDTLLVAIDNSEFAAQVLQAVGQFKLEPTAKVILVHVVSSDTLDFDAVVDRPHAQGNEIAYREVEKLLQSYQEMLPCESELEIVAGIGCRGLTGLKRILEGSVSAEVVAEAPCSVLVVRSR
ncbi:MAG: universal stress protein [Microcoleus sp. PH2017_17_BER_D_A]|nr:universal stress protein [Microcoleus sp. PH2017_17_BER_D_A]